MTFRSWSGPSDRVNDHTTSGFQAEPSTVFQRNHGGNVAIGIDTDIAANCVVAKGRQLSSKRSTDWLSIITQSANLVAIERNRRTGGVEEFNKLSTISSRRVGEDLRDYQITRINDLSDGDLGEEQKKGCNETIQHDDTGLANQSTKGGLRRSSLQKYVALSRYTKLYAYHVGV